MTKLIIAMAMAAAVLMTGCATAPADKTPPSTIEPSIAHEAQDRAQLDKAVALIGQSKPAEAIQVLDGLIDGFEARYRNSPQRIYSARSPAEALSYMLQASNEKRNARAIGPEWGQAQYIKGYALIDLGRLAQAHAALERAVDLAPANAQYRSELGHVYQVEKNWPKALDTFIEAERDASLSPDKVRTSDHTRALRGQGFALVEMGRLDEAETRYRRCLELDPGDKMAQAELRFIAQRRARPAS